jgi:hypothetical protein
MPCQKCAEKDARIVRLRVGLLDACLGIELLLTLFPQLEKDDPSLRASLNRCRALAGEEEKNG